MADSTSNHDKVIVTDGTKHKFYADKCDDVCLDPNTGTTAPFPNQIYSAGNLTANKTVNTKIAGNAICVEPTWVGPLSDFEHPPHVIGKSSGKPYRQHARADSHSEDVKAEGEFVVRTGDTTFQNADNTSGLVDGSELGDYGDTELEFLKKRCTIKVFKGKSGDRELGKRNKSAKKKDYLEILTAETVDFETERWDMTHTGGGDPPKNPPCELQPKHTVWRADRSGGRAKDARLDGTGETFEVTKSFTSLPGAQPDTTKVSPSIGSGDAAVKATVGAGSIGVEAGGVSAEVDWASFRELFQFLQDPCYIQVKALACSNAKAATLRLYPSRKMVVKASIPAHNESSPPFRGKAGDVATKFRDFLMELSGLLELIGEIVGVETKLKFKMFENFELSFLGEYRHCEKTCMDGHVWLSPAHCGFYWEFAVSCDTLLYISMSFEFPLASLAAKLIPVVGEAVSRGIKWLEKKLKTGLFVRITVGAGFGLKTALARDQHGTFINDGSGTAAIIKAELGLALVARVVGLTGDVGLSAKGEVTIGMTPPQRPGYFMRVALDGNVKVFFECSLQYKGKFSRLSTFTAWIGDSLAGDYVSLGDKDKSGKRTVAIKYNKKIMEWDPQPIGKEFIKLSKRKA